jgi:hypothetical protein
VTRPKILPSVAAALTSQLPSRLVKRLDAEPELAAAWTWTPDSVTTDKGETVRLSVDGSSGAGIVTGVTCTCLLQPKCLHVGAVVALLEPVEEIQAVIALDPVTPYPDLPIHTDSSSANRAFAVAADVLAAGAQATGAFAQAELLRAIHACRTAGQHRLAATATRILRSVRELRSDKPEFQLEVLAADLRELLAVAWQIGHGETTPALLGSARRDYEPVGSLRLYGVFTEAVVARSGYAGAVTYLVDDKGAFYSRADVAPGDAARAAGAYESPAGLGDAVLPHRELGRAGLFVSDATASADGRLGAGQRVRAVRATEASRWDRLRWDEPLAAQIGKLAAHDAATESLRPAGWDLVFLEGEIVAPVTSGIAFAVGDATLTLTTALDHRGLAARDNLGVLGRGIGVKARVIGRARLGSPHRIELLAIGPREGEDRLVLPDTWQGRANLAFDRLGVPAPGPKPKLATLADASHEDLLAPLRRRIERVVQGGVGTLPTHALAEIDREAVALSERSLGGGAQALCDLGAVAHAAGRAMTGARKAIDRPAFARAWLRAALYEDAARRRLSVARWTR